MTVFLAIVASFVVYYALGIWLVARPYVTREMAQTIAEFPSLSKDPVWLADHRRTEAGFGLLAACIWPAVLLYRVLIHAVVSAPLAPAEAELLLAQRARRIAELEREAGIRP